MPSLTQRASSLTDGAAGIPPTVRSLAIVTLLALIVLVLLRHLFGSARIEVGSK